MSWTHALRRHGNARSDTRFVIEHCGLVFVMPAPGDSEVPDVRLVYLGDDGSGPPLEVMGVEMGADASEDQHLRVIHAMELRRKYCDQYEEAQKWRV
jgi:hypothetical protein